MVIIPFTCTLFQQVSNQFHSRGITSEMEELRLVGSISISFLKLSDWTTKSFILLTFHIFIVGCRLCAGVGDPYAEEAAREREKHGSRCGGGGRSHGGEQQVGTKESTTGTVERDVCSESGECWIAHGKGRADQIQGYSSYCLVQNLLVFLVP